MLENCRLCPRYCGVNRECGEVGYCGCGSKIKIARYSLHMWEEPCISGNAGSGTIFFSCCNLRCVYCQNYDISIMGKGREISVEEFSDICLDLQNNGALNINLVTAVMYIPLVVDGIKLAKRRGLSIPIVYNSSGYESVEGLKLLEGSVDIYLVDFKYYDNELSSRYSGVNNYKEYASEAIEEMYRQVGKNKFNKNKMMIKGLIIRHLVLPGCSSDSKMIIKYLFDTYNDNIYLSIMNQYTPVRKIGIDSLDRCVTNSEYDNVVDFAYEVGVRNAFVQEGETQKESFIPDFDVFRAI